MSMTARFVRLAVLAAAVPLLLPAQQQSQMLHITYYKVQPGMAQDFREMQKIQNEAHKKAGTPWRDVWSTLIFGEPMFVTVFPVGKMTRYNSPNPVRAMLNDTDYARYIQQMSKIVASSQNVLVRTRPDLGISGGRQAAKYAVVTTVEVMPGKQTAFEGFITADLKPVWQKAGLKEVWVHTPVLGDSNVQYVILGLFDDWNEMEGGTAIERALGVEGARKLRDKAAGMTVSVKNMAATRIAELSYMQQ